jgi:DNA-binding XRE family transcriptional regulator/predicted RNase H-like HicB family nuclease
LWFAALVRWEGTEFVVRVPDFPEVVIRGSERRAVCRDAADALDRHLATVLARGELPLQPTDVRAARGEHKIRVSVRPAVAVVLQLRWMRQRQGLSMEEVAHRMGVSRQRVAKIESGARNWTLETLDRVTRALGGELEVVVRGPARGPNARSPELEFGESRRQ